MKYTLPTTAAILTLFLFTQFIGLAVNKYYFTTELPYGIRPPEVKKEITPWYFISLVVIVTLAFLVLRKLKFELLMKIWFGFAFIICSAITLSAFMENWIALIVAATLTIIRLKERDLIVHNISELLVYGGVVAIFVPILNFTSTLILLILISIYDFIAVNITKHMIGLAKMQEELGIFSGLIIVNKNEVAILGGGDVAFTLLFASIVLKTFGGVQALFSIYGATISLIILMMIGKKKKFYPAMPFITAGLLSGFLISLV